MNKKKVSVVLLCCFIFSVILFSRFFRGPDLVNHSLMPFNELITTPDYYKMLDFANWEDGMSRTSLYSVKNSEICVTEDDSNSVAKITEILNKKNFTPITKSEFDLNYNESNTNVKLWISTGVDAELANNNFYPFNIFICEDMSLYVVAIKANDYRYLKSVISDEEYRFMQQSYDVLFNKKNEQ